MTATSERLMQSLFDTKTVNSLTDAMTNVLSLFTNFTEALGGGRGLLLMLGSVGTQVFGTQIATSIVTTINNLKAARRETTNFQEELQNIEELSADPDIIKDPIVQIISAMRTELEEVEPYMSQDQIDQAKKKIQEVVLIHEEATKKISDY